MPDTSSTCEVVTSPFGKPRGAVEGKSDNQLREENDTFWIKRILKILLLFWAIVFISAIAISFLWKMILSSEFRSLVAIKFIDNLTVIIISSFSILGINFANKN